MRLKLELRATDKASYKLINLFLLNAAIYDLLKGTELSNLHEKKGFKYFNFTNIFPVEDFEPNKDFNWIISSPNKKLIKIIKKRAEEQGFIRIGKLVFVVKKAKQFYLDIGTKWISATPIVLYKDNLQNIYFNIKQDKDPLYFYERLKENALKKYTTYFNLSDFSLPFEMFETMELNKSVVINIRKEKKEFKIPGSLWKFKLPKLKFWKYKKFYKFILDVGLGEKNSMGFGMVNPLKK